MQTVYVGNTLINDVFVGSTRMDDVVSYPITLQQESYMFLSSSATINNYTIASAVNTLVTDLKGYGIWDKLYCVYPMVGSSASSSQWNLKDTTNYNLNYTGSWTFNASGMTCTGTQFANTNFFGQGTISNFSQSFSIGVYSTTSPAGGVDLGETSNNAYLAARYSDNTIKFIVNPNNQSTANTDGKGFYIGTINKDGVDAGNRTYKNGTLVNSAGVISGASTTISIYSIGGYLADPGSRGYAFAFIGGGLSATNISNFNTAMTTFQTTLGRNV
jgi:hypothetical protein